MPAMLDDPNSPAVYRTSGWTLEPSGSTTLPPDILPRQVMLRDRITQTTLVPFSAADQVPHGLLAYLCNQLNKEIEKGDTYPMVDAMSIEAFGSYWFTNFGAVMLLGDVNDPTEVMHKEQQGCDWEKECLGSFYIKPNYPGRSSHVCNGAFLVTDGARNRGVGRLMGEGYLDYAPKLGYTYSIFNLVYETNTPSCRIWDALGFKRVGRVKGCGNLKSYPGQLIDAIIFGRDLGQDTEDAITEERFERIKYYLKYQRYPEGADRAEKSRLRSASTHYKILPATATEPEKLMLKGKEVISDPQQQYDAARRVHMEQHGGINKTTAIITERYHWVRIKDTVTQVIKNCSHCKDVPTKSIYPYGRKEEHPKKTTIPPFEREFSVPPGERSLRAHGYSVQAPSNPQDFQQPVQAATPGAYAEEPPEPSTDLDVEAAPEMDHFSGFMQPDITFPDFGNVNDQVPVDPELTNGAMPPNDYHQLQQEVRRLQRTQVFGTSVFEPRETQALPSLEPGHESEPGPVPEPEAEPTIEEPAPITESVIEVPTAVRISSRRSTVDTPEFLMNSPEARAVNSYRNSRRSSTQGTGSASQRRSQTQRREDDDVLDAIHFNAKASQPAPQHQQDMETPPAKSTRGAKRQAESDSNSVNAAKRVTRRSGVGAGSTPQAGHVSEDAWMRQLRDQTG